MSLLAGAAILLIVALIALAVGWDERRWEREHENDEEMVRARLYTQEIRNVWARKETPDLRTQTGRNDNQE